MTQAVPPTPGAPAGRPSRRGARWLVATVLLVGLVFTVLVGAIGFRVWWVARGDDRARVDAIIVLGASQYDGTPSPVLEARLDHAKALFDDGVAPRIITVGGKRTGDRFTEAVSGKDWLVENGMSADDVIAVGKGTDTWNSLVAVDGVMERNGWDSAVLVTDPWHSFRAREMARHLGLDATSSPTRSGPVVQERRTEVRYVVRETAAYAAFLWQRLTGTLPQPAD